MELFIESVLMDNKKFTYVTLLSSDNFAMGVIMLSWSLSHVSAQYPLLVLCSNMLSQKSIQMLEKSHINYRVLTKHISVDTSKVNTDLGYDHWNYTFDKLFVWTLTDYEKVVFLDSDMQVIRNIDYLFNCPHMSAVRADQWNEPGIDKLNSGLMVIRPSMDEFEGLQRLWKSGAIKSKNVGDQDIIRAYYANWGKNTDLTLPPGLNVLYSEITHGIIRAENVRPVFVIHYIGPRKPWMVSPRAILRRTKQNFLGKYLLQYAMVMYFQKLRIFLDTILVK